MTNAVGPEADGACVAEGVLLNRSRFLELCVASMAGLSLLGLAGCGGGQDGDGNGGNGDGNGKKDKEDGGGGGY